MPYIKNALATKISIASPRDFKQSILRLASRDGLDNVERRAIKAARDKARVRMHSRLISEKERRNLRKIVNLKI